MFTNLSMITVPTTETEASLKRETQIWSIESDSPNGSMSQARGSKIINSSVHLRLIMIDSKQGEWNGNRTLEPKIFLLFQVR